ncbi:MFS transporter [Clostridium sp. C2-6-12]|uniref:MFS transporter n=1 Tax=Clostridium sp. C2-6-12 TaxID=2698832 RepID=UPI00136D8406|nr:MFS transporter [Clostridium sp. C2-6-12]
MNFNLLKNKNFSLLMLSKALSLTGTQMQEFALSLYVLKISNSATLFSTVLIVAIIPQLLFSPVAGVLSDWMDRKGLTISLDIVSGILVLIFAIAYKSFGGLSISGIYILVIFLSLISSLYQPAIGTIIPTVVKKDDLVDANGLSSLILTIGNLIAPFIAGILFGSYGLVIILLINSSSFFFSSFAIFFIKMKKSNHMPKEINLKAFNSDFKEGLKFIKENSIILNIIILASSLNFVFSPLFSTGITFISKKLFEISDFQYGFMQMILFSSMLISPFITGKLTQKFSLGSLLFYNFFICSILIGIMSIIPSPIFLSLFNSNLIPYISITVMCFFIILLITIANIAISSMVQNLVPLAMLGRVSTVMNTCCTSIMPLGLILFGILFDSISAWICVLICFFILLSTILILKKSLLKPNNSNSIKISEEFNTI